MQDADVAPLLRTQLDALATDRVARAFLHLGQPDVGARTMAAYSRWIAILDDPTGARRWPALGAGRRSAARSSASARRSTTA